MLSYDLRLAWQSLKRNPGLALLMMLAVALGIAVCSMAFTIYNAVSRNPIEHRSEVLYAVTMDAWDPTRPANERRPELPPEQLTWRDAWTLMESDIPTRQVIGFKGDGVLDSQREGTKPFRVIVRLTNADFFGAFDVPFEYGSTWSAAADAGPEPAIVLSHETNLTAFGGENSVGRTILFGEREFRVVGVLAEWDPVPKFYDLNNGPFQAVEDAYLPIRLAESLEMYSTGNTNCWKSERIESYRDFMNSECIWIQLWAELPDAQARESYQAFVDNYARAQKAQGRMQRPLNNRLLNVPAWLEFNEVVDNDNRVLLGLALLFLAVCLVNVIGLLLAKFLNGMTLTGLRRALGASRFDIVRQHLTEVLLIAAGGGMLGLLLGLAGLAGLRALYGPEAIAFEKLTRLDTGVMAACFGLALLAGLIAGLYPAWRVGRTAPASYLKAQ